MHALYNTELAAFVKTIDFYPVQIILQHRVQREKYQEIQSLSLVLFKGKILFPPPNDGFFLFYPRHCIMF